MHVEMVCHPGTGRPAEVEAEIKTIGLILTPERTLALLSQIKEFMQFLGCGIIQEWDVAVGYNKQVPGRVGEKVQQDEKIPAASKEIVVLIPIFRENAAKHTAIIGFPNVVDVVETPGRPEVIHRQHNQLQPVLRGNQNDKKEPFAKGQSNPNSQTDSRTA
jgi:hypothetical protein